MTDQKKNMDQEPKDIVKLYLRITQNEMDDDILDGDFAADKAIEAFANLYQQFEVLAKEHGKPSQSSINLQVPKGSKGGIDFKEMARATKYIVKIQSWFRKELTLRKLEREMKERRAALLAKKGNETPEELALREFSQQLMNKNLTPEAFFRICDSDYKQSVQAANFKDQLAKFGVKLSRGQLSRLIMILDEDMEGNITRNEYYDALEAYNVSCEKHKSFDGSIYHPFEHRALFKLIVELKKKNISYLEMFNACDINDDTRVNIQEIGRFVEGLSPEIKQKELHSLMNYLDIDKNGIVDKDEFLRQLAKGEQTYKQSQVLNKQIAERNLSNSQSRSNIGRPAVSNDNFFQEESVGGGDQAFFGFENPLKNVFGSKQPVPAVTQDKPPAQPTKGSLASDPDELKRKVIIEKMEREGQNFNSFFQSLKQQTVSGLIPLGTLLKALEVAYPTLTPVERNFLIKPCMSEKAKIDYVQLEQLFTKYSKNLKPSVSQTFTIIIGNIIQRMKGSNAEDSLRQFLRAQNIQETDQLSEMEFSQLFSGKFGSLSQSDLDQAFKSLDTDYDGFIQVHEFLQVLLSYSDQNSKTQINTKALHSIIPGYEAMSPRTRCEEIIQVIIENLNKKNLKPIMIFKMADSKNTGGVQAMVLELTLKKMLPDLSSEVIAESFTAFRLKTNRDIISRQDFEAVFAETQNSYVPNSSGLNFKQQQVSPNKSIAKQANLTGDDSMKWIRKLDNAMLRERISPGVAFKSADINHNGVVTVDELKESIKRLIPEDSLSLAELKNVMMAFDKNKNGLIEEDEFISLIEQARNSNITYTETPQKNRFSREDFIDKTGALPLKGESMKQQQPDTSTINIIVDTIETKISLKKFFAEIPINEQGQMAIAHIGRRFKTAETFDGKGLSPSEYLPIIKSLDLKQEGLVFVKDVFKFLEKYATSFEMDSLLELKFMANFIEYQMKSKNTKVFFQNNTKLSTASRLMEVELMTELSKVFGISMQIGRILYNQLLKQKTNGGDIMLDDLCRMIDQYRIVQVEIQAADQKLTQSQKLNPQKTLQKFVLKMLSLTERKRELINQKIVEIGQREKSVPYKDFFDLFVTEHQLIDIPESKALFEHLRSLGTKNAIEVPILTSSISQTQQEINHAMSQSFGNALIAAGEQVLEGLTKVKMNEHGYISKIGLLQHLIQFNVINKKGSNPLDSEYVKNLKNLLIITDKDITPNLQADEYVNSVLIQENENIKFWSIIDLIAKSSEKYNSLQNLILKYLGKLFDQIVPNKATTQGIQIASPQSIVMQNGDALIMMIQKLEQWLMKTIQGFNQGVITDPCQDCLDSLYKKLGNNQPIKIVNDDHPFIQAINRNRGLLPVSQQQESKQLDKKEQAPLLQTQKIDSVLIDNNDVNQIVLTLEKQMEMPLEITLKNMYEQDVIPALSFQKLLNSVNEKVEKHLVAKLNQFIDPNKIGKITVRNLIVFLKSLKDKYDQQKVMTQIAQDIDEPVQQFFEAQGIVPNEQYDKNEFCDVIHSISNISHFHCLCIFFDIIDQSSDTASGKQIIQKFTEFKNLAKSGIQQKKAVGLDDSREEKKVRFGENSLQKDVKIIKILCEQFVSEYKAVSDPVNIERAIKKFQDALKSFKTVADAVSKFDPSGKGILSVDVFKAKLDTINGLSENEKLAISFIPVNQNIKDIIEIDADSFLKVIRLMTIDQTTLSQNKQILSKNYDAIRAYLGMKVEELKQIEQSPPRKLAEQKKTDLTASASKKFDRKARSKARYIEKMNIILDGLKKLSTQPQKVKQLLDIFVASKTQKIQYKRLHQFLKEVGGIQAPEPQFDTMEGQIDVGQSGYFMLADFLAFCEKFDIPIKSDLAKQRTVNLDKRDAKQQFQMQYQFRGEHLKCGTLEYTIVPERDFYIKGMTTILNSEKAALVMAEKLYNALGEDEEYHDNEFGPKDENDDQGHRFSLYCNGTPPKGYINPDDIDWLRPEDITEERAMFLDDGPAPNDVIQGKIGDCWFIGALSVLATRDELLRGGIGSIEVGPNFEANEEIAEKFSFGVYPPLFHYYRKKGIYVFRFFKEFNWRYIIIDDRIPCFSMSKKPVFGQCSQLHELWVPLIEKAYAKINGCYESLISGFIDDALTDLTGLVAEKMQLHNENKIFPHRAIKDKETFWQQIHKLAQSKEKSMMGCSVVGDVEREIVIDGIKTGIMTGHAYGIIDVFEIQGPIRKHRLLRIRNPWGSMEWKGKWSDKSEEVEKYKDIIYDQYISKLAEDEKFTPGIEDGTFLMNYQSWRDIYNNMYICVDFPAEWDAVRFRGSWDATTSGGVPSPMTDENMKRWAKNPQYLIEAYQDFEIFISLAQPDGRPKRPDGSYLKFPYAELIHPILFTVLELPKGKTKLEAFDKTLVKGASVLKQHREVSLRLQLPAGRYIIVPSTRNQGQYGDYTLSLYFSVELEEIEITRLDKPEDEFKLIEEETERYDDVEDWKIDLCDQRIKYMLFQEDEGVLNESSILNNSTSMIQGGLKLSVALDKATSKTKAKQADFDPKEAFPEIDDDIE